MMKEIVLATGNKGKVAEMATLLQEFGFNVKAQNQWNVPEVAETGQTFIENAIIKARHAAKLTGLPAIADDSGLEVDALNGAPGIYSARFSGEGATDAKNNQKLLQEMKDVPKQARTARFHCVLVLMRHENDPTPLVCHGVFEGHILSQLQGENGFGYDPLFWIESENKTSAQISSERKKEISHRGRALGQLFEQLKANPDFLLTN